MKAEIEGGKLSLNIVDLFDAMSDEAVKELVDALACHDAIAEEVANLLVDGFTSQNSHPCKDECAAEPWYPLGKAIRRVAESADEVHGRVLAGMARELADAEATVKRMEEAYQDWPHDSMGWQVMHAARFGK